MKTRSVNGSEKPLMKYQTVLNLQGGAKQKLEIGFGGWRVLSEVFNWKTWVAWILPQYESTMTFLYSANFVATVLIS